MIEMMHLGHILRNIQNHLAFSAVQSQPKIFQIHLHKKHTPKIARSNTDLLVSFRTHFIVSFQKVAGFLRRRNCGLHQGY